MGVAYGAQVSGLRILDGTVTDLLEGQSFIYKAHVNWIYSCSWGPEDNGMSVEGPGYIARVSPIPKSIVTMHRFFTYRKHLNLGLLWVAMVMAASLCLLPVMVVWLMIIVTLMATPTPSTH